MTSTFTADPLDPVWAKRALGSLSQRAQAGEDADELRDELFEALWPWTLREAERAVVRLPSWADRNVTRSEIILAVWQATRRIGWERTETWPVLLRRRLRGAVVDAARNDDTVSRRLRQGHHQLARAVAQKEQEGRRHLCVREQDELAATLWPSARPQWLKLLRSPGESPLAMEEAFQAERGPEDEVLDGEQRRAVRAWLTALPPELALEVLTWAERPRAAKALPRRLLRRLEPHLDSLRRVVGDDAGPVLTSLAS
ncbi:MAG: hypothetical protein ACRD0J_00770 [Acidimicrobiales bacterium]